MARRGEDLEARQAWSLLHDDRCDCCWVGVGTYGVRHEIHHMLDGKYGRPDRPWNFLRLCFQWTGNSCHRLAEGERIRREDGVLWPILSDANCLWLKQESDPDNYDPEAMQAWMARVTRKRLPEPEPIPELLLNQRHVNARRR